MPKNIFPIAGIALRTEKTNSLDETCAVDVDYARFFPTRSVVVRVTFRQYVRCGGDVYVLRVLCDRTYLSRT